MKIMKKIALVLCACLPLAAYADDDSPVTPYRPSVSSPAQLPVPGQLELEVGGLRTQNGGQKRDSLPYQLKLGFNPQWGVLLGGEAYVSAQNAGGHRDGGVGDTTLVLKRAFLVDDATAYGVEFAVKMPTANDVIGSGKTDYGINAIFSKDIAKLHMDANLNVTRLGAADAGSSHLQTGTSASFSIPVTEKWGATFELSGVRRSGSATTGQMLVAGTYSPTKRVTIDFGVAKGLTHASQDWSLFSGIVVPVANFW
jgi:hypothetical protein